MRLVLCGLPTCGKSTISQRIALHFRYPFIDTDDLIEKSYLEMTGKTLSCREIYLKEGIFFFRGLEKKKIALLEQTHNDSVIALGGGALMDSQNQLMIKKIGRVIYLKVPFHLIWERMKVRGIPPYLDPKDPTVAFENLALERNAIYEKVADKIIDMGSLDENEATLFILNSLKEVNDGK